MNLLKISRVRFWIYILGPYWIGVVAGAQTLNQLYNPGIFLVSLLFALPANLLIYGINDIFDYQTDKLNPKKKSYESLVPPHHHQRLIIWIIVINTPFLLFIFWISNYYVWISLLLFLFFSIFYSTPPIRAKSKPFLDSVFNMLYIFPGLIGFYLIGGTSPIISLIIAATCWCMAMHTYSAIPDITVDQKDNLLTTAVLLGFHKSLVYCLILYLISSYLTYSFLGYLSIILALTYSTMIFLSYKVSPSNIFKIYKLFPLINTICGAILFWYIILTKFS